MAKKNILEEHNLLDRAKHLRDDGFGYLEIANTIMTENPEVKLSFMSVKRGLELVEKRKIDQQIQEGKNPVDEMNMRFMEQMDSSIKKLEKIESLHPYLIDPENLFVFHMPQYATYPILDVFRSSLAHYGLNARIVAPFTQRDGRPIYFVCQATPPALESQRQLGKYFYFREGEEHDACSTMGLDFKPTASRRRSCARAARGSTRPAASASSSSICARSACCAGA